jgi:hypothetical protein
MSYLLCAGAVQSVDLVTLLSGKEGTANAVVVWCLVHESIVIEDLPGTVSHQSSFLLISPDGRTDGKISSVPRANQTNGNIQP